MTDLEQFIATCEAHAVPDSEIDFSDIPELTDEQIAQMKPSYLIPSGGIPAENIRTCF